MAERSSDGRLRRERGRPRALVVYESFYGNTETIADRIADGLARRCLVDSVRIDALRVGEIAALDLLVVGAPTQEWTLPRSGTGQGSATPRSAGVAASHPSLRDWLAALPPGHGRACAAFSTRWARPELLTGSAAVAIEQQLVRHGWTCVAPAQSFVVEGLEGPLRSGEPDRAEAWGSALARALRRPRVPPTGVTPRGRAPRRVPPPAPAR
jgi:hypothetical protein